MKWIQSLIVSVTSPLTCMTFSLQKLMVSEIQMKRDEFKLFFWKRIKPTLPYHLLLKKIAKWGRDKCKWGEYNIFSKAAPPTFMTFFFAKIAWHLRVKYKQDEFKLFFFCKRIEPTLPYHLLLKKIAKWGRVKRKWGESNIFSKAVSQHAPMTSFFLCKNG